METLYIFLSEKEESITNDYQKLLSKKVFKESDLDGSSVLVCISRDYLDQKNTTPAIMIRDQLCNVFCPQWRTNSIRYEPLFSLMTLPGDKIPQVKFITENIEVYDNIDYYLHLSNFNNRYKILLSKANSPAVPIVSQVTRDDVRELGLMSLKIIQMAGYDKDINGPVPGWIFQVANPWLTRVLDLYQISSSLAITPLSDPVDNLLELTPEIFAKMITEPTVIESPKIGEDMRSCLIDSFEVRKTIMEYTADLLERTE